MQKLPKPDPDSPLPALGFIADDKVSECAGHIFCHLVDYGIVILLRILEEAKQNKMEISLPREGKENRGPFRKDPISQSLLPGFDN